MNGAADVGCLDMPGELSAPATDWYPGNDGSAVGLSGERADSPGDDEFQRSASETMRQVAPAFRVSERFDYRRSNGGCVSHRYAVFTSGDDQIVVSAWRVVSAADPNWVPNEAPFVPLDDSTLVSNGRHIEVVLGVASDGTTVRVTSYGAHAEDMVEGWPSTVAPPPSAPTPGPATATFDQLVRVARSVLRAIVDQR